MRHTNRGRPLRVGLVATMSAALPLGSAFGAEVHKFMNASGQVEFTDAPCGAEQTSAMVDVRPNTLDNSAVREQLLKIENKSLHGRLAERRALPGTSLQEGVDASRADSSACRTAKRDLEVAATSIEMNRALIQARRTAMYSECGLREPDKQTTNVNVGRGARRNGEPAEEKTR